MWPGVEIAPRRRGAEVDLEVAVQPLVGHAVVVHRRPAVRHHRPPALGELLGAGRPQPVHVRVLVEGVAVHQVHRGLVAEPERHVGADLATDHGRLRVVVAVHVRDQEPADVAHGVAELLQTRVEDLARLGDGPAAVDQHQPVVGLDDVDVDGTQAVHRQRQRQAVHPGRDLEGARLGPLARRARRRSRSGLDGCTVVPRSGHGRQVLGEDQARPGVAHGVHGVDQPHRGDDHPGHVVVAVLAVVGEVDASSSARPRPRPGSNRRPPAAAATRASGRRGCG